MISVFCEALSRFAFFSNQSFKSGGIRSVSFGISSLGYMWFLLIDASCTYTIGSNWRGVNLHLLIFGCYSHSSTEMNDKFPSQLAERFQIRMPDGLRDKIREAAEANKRSMNTEIVARLEESFEAAGSVSLDQRTVFELASQLADMLIQGQRSSPGKSLLGSTDDEEAKR
jgi:hypothetical protein